MHWERKRRRKREVLSAFGEFLQQPWPMETYSTVTKGWFRAHLNRRFIKEESFTPNL